MKRLFLVVATFSLLGPVSAGAAAGPDYQPPKTETASHWQASTPQGASLPADWWAQFHDPALTVLLQAAEVHNPTLDQALAAIASARASLDGAQAASMPSLSGSASVLRAGDERSAVSMAGGQRSGALDASWELDLFGGQRRSKEAAKASVEASVASWQNARISLQAEVAQDYVSYRACQLTLKSQAANVQSLQQTASLTHGLAAAGFTSSADDQLAMASAASSRAALIDQQASCDVLVKSLVALTGQDESALRGTLQQTADTLPTPQAFAVDGLPAEQLRQRPDLIAAERNLAAASARIGVAEAELYPKLSLGGVITATAATMMASTAPWSVGPALSLNLFDGGRARAGVASAQAGYDAALASYRQAVREAVKDVETALARLDAATRREVDVATSANGYRAYFNATETNWRAGGESLLALEQTRRDALNAEQQLIAVQRDRVLYWIALYKALGGGWNAGIKSSAGARS